MSPGSGRAVTDEHGRFEVRGLDAHPHKLSLRGAEHLDTESEVLALADGRVIDDLRIVMSAGEELRGVVRWPGRRAGRRRPHRGAPARLEQRLVAPV